MKTYIRQFAGFGVFFFGVAAAIGAQQASDSAHVPSPSMQRSAASRAFVMERVDGQLRAAGPDYKARFDATGVTYTPALGRQASRNYPWHFAVQTIRRGDTVLFDAAKAPAVAPQHDGAVASYDRGASIVERYVARSDGIKQDFVFTAPMSGQGDLVVEGRITTELAMTAPATEGVAARFVAEGIGGVAIGDVVGIDRRGRKQAGELSCDGERIRFVLPNEFVDRAAYPLVLDPLVSTARFVETATAVDPDVAYDETYDVYLIVWEQEFSAVDTDIRARLMKLAGTFAGGLINVTFEPGHEINPAVANTDLGNRFFIAFQDGPTPFGPWHIRGRSITSDPTSTMTPIINISAPGGANEFTPDVGGDSSFVDDSILVVWSDDSGRTIGTKVEIIPNTVALPTVLRFSGSANPAISKSGGPDGRFVIVWEQDFGTDRDIQAALVDRNMTVLDSFAAVGLFSALDDSAPDVDGDGTSFVVVLQRQESASSTLHDIYCQRMGWDGSDLKSVGGMVAVSSVPGLEAQAPAIGLLGQKYVVAWSSGAAISPDIAMVELDPATCLACGVVQTTSGGTNVLDFGPEIATRYQGRPSIDPITQDQGLLVWSELGLSPTRFLETDVVAHLYEAFGGGAVTDLGGACGSGGNNGFNGPVALGNSQLELTLSGATTPIVFASIQFVNATQTCGPCTFNAQNSYVFTLANGAGGASFPLAIPCDPSFHGLGVFTQWASFLSGANPCGTFPASAEVSFSNRLEAVIGS
ncbi:MAG: hypothetical protein NXI31_11610 [bacterium]|nr:hypothetical protein [bacterium]